MASQNAVEVVINALDRTSPAFASAVRNVEGFKASAANIASTLVTAFAGATGAIIGLAENFAKTAEEVQNFSARTGIAEDNVSRLMFVAKESAIPIEALQKGLKNAAQQAAAAGKTFQDFLLDEADRFASAADGAAKAAEATRVFGKSGLELIPILNLGKEGLRSAMAEADRFSTVIGKQTAANADYFGDTLNRIGSSIQRVFNAAIADALPYLIEFARAFLRIVSDFADGSSKFGFISDLFKLLAKSVALTATVFESAQNVIAGFADVLTAKILGTAQDATDVVDTFWQTMESGWKRIEDLWNDKIELPGTKPNDLAQMHATIAALDQATQLSNKLRQEAARGSEELRIAAQVQAASVDLEIDKLKEAGIQDDAINQLRAANKANLLRKEAELQTQGLAIEADIAQQRKNGNFKEIRDLLDSEQGANLARLENNRAVADSYVQIWKQAHTNVAGLTANLATTFSGGLAHAMSDIILHVKSAGEAFKELGKAMIASVVNFVTQWIASRVALAALNAIFGATMVAQVGVQASAIGAIWAPAAALASLATLGGNAAPANAAILATVGFAKGASALGGIAHGGLDYVPSESTFLLQRGERVIQPAANKDLIDFLQNQKGGSNSPTMVELHLDGEVLGRGIGRLSRDGRLILNARSIA